MEGNQRSLIIACKNIDIEAFEHALQNHANPNEADPVGRTPVHITAAQGNLDMLKTLICAGADLESVDIYGNTALHYSCHIDIAQYLIEHGMDPLARNKNGDIAADIMRRKGANDDVISYLESFHSSDCSSTRKSSVSTKGIVLDTWYGFCEDLGPSGLALLLVVLVVLSLWVAYRVSEVYRHTVDTREVILPQTGKTEL